MQQHVPGLGLDVAAVEVRVGALLLDHEDVLAELADAVDGVRVEPVERDGEDLHRRNSRVRAQASSASGTKGSSG